jgi:hypothetical protein
VYLPLQSLEKQQTITAIIITTTAAAEQKGCHSGSKGCKDQLLISKSNIGGLQEEKKEFKLGMD